MTKPVQGALFRKFRDQIMGVVMAQDPGPGKPKSAKEKQIEEWQSKGLVQKTKGKGLHHRSVLESVGSQWTYEERTNL